MIHDLKPYPAYKDSGVPWLGEVPEHWELKRGKWLFRHRKEINDQRTHTNILSLTLRGVVNNDPDDPEGLVPKDYATYQFFAKGDLVFKLIDLENLRTSRVGLVHEDGIMSSAYVRLVPQHSGVQRFFFHQYFDLYQRGIFNQLGAGVRSTLGPSDLLNVGILVPSADEQSAIVRFLDYVDRRIRRYIRAKKKLIELLNEQKQAIIHRAVTRGLDPDVRLKPSGVEWLGDVPEHWELRRLKTLSWMRSGESITSLSIEPTGTYPVYGGNGIRGYAAEFTHEGEYALIGRQGALCGNVHLAHGRFWASEHAVVASLDTGFDLEWFAAILMVMNLNQYSMAAAQPGIAVERVLNLWIPVPPADDQRRIAENIKRATEGIVATASSAQRGIDLLREYHTRLIADVVTGKIDVREAAARLPEEEAEWEDESPEEGEIDAAGLDESEGGAHEEQ
jgi:type I restriction enzyme S subunit